jgi:hypothetical protein
LAEDLAEVSKCRPSPMVNLLPRHALN